MYQVQYFEKAVLQVNTLSQHLQRSLQLYRSLNAKVVTPIVEVISLTDAVYLVSKAHPHSLEELVRRREGLSDFEIAYFMVDLMELMNYLRSRECLLEKVELADLFLSEDLKLTISFSLLLTQLKEKPVIRKLPFRSEITNRNNCPDLFFK